MAALLQVEVVLVQQEVLADSVVMAHLWTQLAAMEVEELEV